MNPYTSWARVIDCGDIPITPFDNGLALRQMTEAFLELGKRKPAYESPKSRYQIHPKLVTLGGDHSVLLPILRALRSIYGQPISVLHFDAHMDSRNPKKYLSYWIDSNDPTTQSFFNHGSMLWLASKEDLIAKNTSVHAGLRARITDWTDFEDDTEQGWHRIYVDDIDDIGPTGILKVIHDQIGDDTPVYLSVDIDVLDPGNAPGTGTPEPGGWTPRELLRLLRGLRDLNLVGADVVEVSPSYDTSEVTAMAASQIVFEIITNMVLRGIEKPSDDSTTQGGFVKQEL